MGSNSPVKRQRLSAYALVFREEAVLLTQLSELSTRPGVWTLPGGGLDHGEDPRAALVREVYEETGLRAEPGHLLDLHSLHHEGVAPDGVLEDYHAVQLVFEATVAPEAPAPRVVERDGTTAAAAWVPLDGIARGAVEVVEIVTRALTAAAVQPPGRAPKLLTSSGAQPAGASGARPEWWRQRITMLREAFERYEAAAVGGDTAGVAGALADMLSVIDGTAQAYGITLDGVLAGPRDSDGRAAGPQS